MRKLSKILLALVLWVAVTASMYAQNQMNLVPVKQNKSANNFIDAEPNPVRKPLNVLNTFSNASKTDVVSFKTLGAAGNSYTAIGANRHRVAANNATNSIVHIHRATVALGGTGKYRIDVSTNAGSTFTNNVLIYDNLASGSIGNGRYPQVVIHNPTGNTNPANAFAGGLGALTGGSGWTGYGMCAAKFDGSMQSEMASANNYLIAQTLHESNGIYWALDHKTNAADDTEDTLVVFKGTWNSTLNRIDWIVNNKLKLGATESNGTPGDYMYQDQCIAFSPNGMVGYVMVRGDLAATHPSNTCAPVLWKTTDGGNSWSLINYDMGSMNIPGVTANLPVDSNRGVPINFFYNADITVDNSGRFHIIGAVAGAAGDGVTPDSTFYLYPNASRYLVHVWGSSATTVSSRMIDSLQEYSFPVGTSTTVNDNARAQISRTEDGTKVFFVWADDHDAIGKPDIWMQGFNTTTNMYTPIKAVTNGGSRDNDAEQLSISPTVLGNAGCYEVPMVIGKPLSDDLSETTYTYIDDAQVCDAEFTISSVGNSVANATEPATFVAYPNPATESVNFTYTLSNKANVELSVFALDGRVVSTITKGNQNAGSYTYTFNRAELPAGVYMARFVVDGKVNHTKVVLH